MGRDYHFIVEQMMWKCMDVIAALGYLRNSEEVNTGATAQHR